MSEIPSTLEDAAAALRAGSLSSSALTAACLERADTLDPALGSYVTRFEDTALARASTADEELAAGIDRGPLHGIPVGVKDLLAASEGPTTANSLVLDPAWSAGRDAPVVRRLREAGAVITGKTVTAEFAMGTPDRSKPFPVAANPWDLTRTPGGSSSGTAVGVSAGFFLTGIGTDTGGSIRMPASLCGVTGLMPTFGRVAKSGCVPMAPTMDHVGPLARSAWDCAATLQALAGYEPSDSSCADRPVPDYCATIDDGVEGLRIGVVHESHYADGCDPSARPAFDAAVAQLAENGATLVDVTLPFHAEIVAASVITMMSEAFAYHRRDLQHRWDDYFYSTRTVATWGAFVQAADYLQAQRVRRVGQRAITELLTKVDVIATPTNTIGAPLDSDFDVKSPSLMDDFLRHIHTIYWNGLGNPVLSLPIGFTSEGLPLGMQLAGRPFGEAGVLRAGRAYQCVTDWHTRVPPLVARAVS